MAFLAEKICQSPPLHIYSSDLVRARESAEVLGRRWGLSPKIWPEFREVNMGLWEGLSYDEISLLYPEQAAKWAKGSPAFRFPQGESLQDLKARVLPAHRAMMAENPDGAFLALVAHAGPNRLILCQALRTPLTRFWRLGQDYGSLSIIDYHGPSAMVSLLNFRKEILGGQSEKK
jgi:alpha-ribazole phosphatase/probable phosphoglycerate mutase